MTVDELTAELDAVRRERERLYRALQVMFRSEADLDEYIACVPGRRLPLPRTLAGGGGVRDWPTEQYGAILADPPWRYKDVSYRGAAEGHYGTMALADIQALPVAAIARGDAALFLWATYPLLPEALSVVAAWGFEYKTVAFTWVKLNANGQPMFGAGRWTRANAEICLLATRGRPERRAMDVSQVILTRRRQHSQKPDEQYGRIMRLVDGPYCELFGRQVWPGWRVWGNDTANRGAQLLLELPA